MGGDFQAISNQWFGQQMPLTMPNTLLNADPRLMMMQNFAGGMNGFQLFGQSVPFPGQGFGGFQSVPFIQQPQFGGVPLWSLASAQTLPIGGMGMFAPGMGSSVNPGLDNLLNLNLNMNDMITRVAFGGPAASSDVFGLNTPGAGLFPGSFNGGFTGLGTGVGGVGMGNDLDILSLLATTGGLGTSNNSALAGLGLGTGALGTGIPGATTPGLGGDDFLTQILASAGLGQQAGTTAIANATAGDPTTTNPLTQAATPSPALTEIFDANGNLLPEAQAALNQQLTLRNAAALRFGGAQFDRGLNEGLSLLSNPNGALSGITSALSVNRAMGFSNLDSILGPLSFANDLSRGVLSDVPGLGNSMFAGINPNSSLLDQLTAANLAGTGIDLNTLGLDIDALVQQQLQGQNAAATTTTTTATNTPAQTPAPTPAETPAPTPAETPAPTPAETPAPTP
ncbi:MAG: hypothetical protein SFZ03_08860 [Candidatus Melainabacteria bacterium]|nr:hypothetical protein [Candidatus Melainabacteria bacterium]